MKPTTLLTAIAAAAALLTAQVSGHGYMVSPKGRTSNAVGDPKDVYACDSTKTGQVTSYQAGQEIEVVWVRNNHLGGFIRYSMVPKGQETKANFDKSTFFYTCRESQCDLKQCKDKFCGDDSGAGDNGIKCRSKIKLPDYLAAGDYVLQWTWHSAGSSYSHIGWSTSNFKTCADIKLTTSGSGTKPQCPTFVGGDRVTQMEKKPSDKCFYFDDTGLGKDYAKYSDAAGLKRYLYGIPKEIEQCGGNATTIAPSPAAGGGGGNSTSPGTKPPTTSCLKPTNSPPTAPTNGPPTPTRKLRIQAPTPTNDDDHGGKPNGGDVDENGVLAAQSYDFRSSELVDEEATYGDDNGSLDDETATRVRSDDPFTQGDPPVEPATINPAIQRPATNPATQRPSAPCDSDLPEPENPDPVPSPSPGTEQPSTQPASTKTPVATTTKPTTNPAPASAPPASAAWKTPLKAGDGVGKGLTAGTRGFSLNARHPIYGDIRPHRGWDIGAQSGLPLYPVTQGSSAQVECLYQAGGAGNYAVITPDKPSGVTFVSMHLSTCKSGTYKRGQSFGAVGTTGGSTGPHIHFEYKLGGTHTHPMKEQVVQHVMGS